ncbi:MAG TPA: radical SAM protein [Candidatus Nanoarchaeia archaeon]|nr:radical SAM protein [Candidatus Nanoarchaeia archaeon]
MKVSLILPPHTFEERYNKKIAKAAGTWPPLGILYIAAILLENGHKVQVLDGSKKDFLTINKELDKFQPDIIGMNVLTFLWNKVKSWTPNLKQRFPNSFIVVGGTHATVAREKCLEECKSIDGVILGEAEFILADLADALEKKKSLSNVKSFIYKEKDKIKINSEHYERLTDLDKLPFPARSLIDIYEYIPAAEQYKKLPVANMITSRGCPYKCTFCGSGNTKAYFRSPQNVLAEFKFLKEKYKVKDIAIWDDTFTLDRQRVLDICKLIRQEKLDIVWSSHSRVNTVDEELLKAMAGAGCWKICYGIESLLQKNLNVIRKGSTVEQNFNAVKWSQKYGIQAEGSFIFGIPGETYEDALQTIALMKKLNPDYMKCFPFTPLPGTESGEKIEEYGTLMSENTDNFTENSVVFTPNSMTKEQLQSLIPKAYKEFYLRPRYLTRYVKNIRSVHDIKRAIKGFSAVTSL